MSNDINSTVEEIKNSLDDDTIKFLEDFNSQARSSILKYIRKSIKDNK